VARVRLERLRKVFGRQVVVDIDDLDVADGAFFSLLGPSGCGKTTTLRLIAGLVETDTGRIIIGDRDATGVSPARRNLGMVFQKHALFPHLSVRENVAFGLRERGVRSADIAGRVTEALVLVSLGEYGDRLPHQLSGGQQQRVALARAVVYRPDVLLLDEPFSSLDQKLRVAMRAELKRLQQVLGITTIFVTHDQHEALALSDRIGVMRDGRMEQVGTPREVYDAPTSLFVADFVGGTNLLAGIRPGTCIAVKPERVRIAIAPIGSESGASPVASWPTGHGDESVFTATGTLESVAYLGSACSYLVRLGDQRIEARTPDEIIANGRPLAAGDAVAVSFDADAVRHHAP
jgi:ABC-type Fe3+/spermidine/putrescine transport system ATPase subunit